MAKAPRKSISVPLTVYRKLVRISNTEGGKPISQVVEEMVEEKLRSPIFTKEPL